MFGKAKSTINEHIKNVYKEGELIENETMTKFGNSKFADKPTNYVLYIKKYHIILYIIILEKILWISWQFK